VLKRLGSLWPVGWGFCLGIYAEQWWPWLFGW
jgi:hypothetical protein